jgi:hypothetical protein
MHDLEGLPAIHFTEVAEIPPDSPIYAESKTFRRELPHLLAAGHEGKWALIKGTEIIGLFGTFDEGYRTGRQQYQFQPFIVQPVREWQPLLRMKVHFGNAALNIPGRVSHFDGVSQ